MNKKAAISAVEKAGALLVFPMDNRKEPGSLWSHFFPKEEMKWEWDDEGDNRVADLWHLRTEISTSRKIVYAKWFRGRATCLSRPLFTAFLRAANPGPRVQDSLSPTARQIWLTLESDSPLSTKEVKELCGLKGKTQERNYDRAMRELWERSLIVAFGEVDDGAFPSLAVGSTRVLFEELWSEAFGMTEEEALARIRKILPEKNLFRAHFEKIRKKLAELPVLAEAAAAKPAARKDHRPKRDLRVVSYEDL